MREWLKKCREAKGYTMKEMAQKLDISECYYCAIENGSRQKKMDIALASSLAYVLGIPISEIVRYEAEARITAGVSADDLISTAPTE